MSSQQHVIYITFFFQKKIVYYPSSLIKYLRWYNDKSNLFQIECFLSGKTSKIIEIIILQY